MPASDWSLRWQAVVWEPRELLLARPLGPAALWQALPELGQPAAAVCYSAAPELGQTVAAAWCLAARGREKQRLAAVERAQPVAEFLTAAADFPGLALDPARMRWPPQAAKQQVWFS